MFAINTRLTESYSFTIVGWETEVGSAGCLNDSVSQPAGLGVSRPGRTLAIYRIYTRNTALLSVKLLQDGAERESDWPLAPFHVIMLHFKFQGRMKDDVRRSFCTKSICFMPGYVTSLSHYDVISLS